jgi:hypothetical protein
MSTFENMNLEKNKAMIIVLRLHTNTSSRIRESSLVEKEVRVKK